MKKFHLFLISLFISSNAFAGTISLGTISADATAGGFNDNFTTIANVINGQIQGSATNGSSTNILADSVGELDMGDEANPRVRDRELLGVGTDSTTTQTAYVYTGLTPATSGTLTSDISLGTAYINGYRVTKNATSETYTASMDTYVDLSQTGTYTLSPVAVAATAPAVAANSARIAKVTTSGTAITTVTDLANRRIPGLVTPSQYRTGLTVSKDSATTLTVFPGTCEINNAMVPKTSVTTLTLGTTGDWAGGVSLATANTFGYVGMDASGNIKMHTTAPTHDNYAVSTTVGKKRYATWSSTVYRILGWFYMNATSQVDVASNIKEGDVSNRVVSNDTTAATNSSTTLAEVAKTFFYNSGGDVQIYGIVSGDSTGATDRHNMEFARSGTVISGSGSAGEYVQGINQSMHVNAIYVDVNRPQGTTNYSVYHRVTANGIDMRRRSIVIEEK